MNKDQLEFINRLFMKRRELEDALNNYSMPSNAHFEIKNVKVEVAWFGEHGRNEVLFNHIPRFTNHDIRRYFMQEKNRIILELSEVNAKIECIKINF